MSIVPSLLNIGRVGASYGGPAGVGHLLGLARDFARVRRVFGAPLADQPMHQAWLARIAAEYEAMLALCFEAAAAVGRAEAGGNGQMARLLAPLTKLSCARQGIWGTSELIESFGGAGYVEDTGLPRIFRNAHVHAIWEGTTTVLSHDVLRALRSRDLGLEWLDDVTHRLANITHPKLANLKPRVAAALDVLRPMVLEPNERDGRRLANGMARVTQAALLAEAADWRIVQKSDATALVAAEFITREPLVQPETADLDFAELAYGRTPAAA